MNQKPIFVLLLFLIFGCQNKQKESVGSIHSRMHEEEEIVSQELQEFHKKLSVLYVQADKNKFSAIEHAGKLIEEIKTNPDTNHLRWNKLGALYNFRAEFFYRMCDYHKSINEIRKQQENSRIEAGISELGADGHNSLASNYVKLKDFDRAKIHLDSAGKGYYLADYLLGNYYEVIGKRTEALNIYNKIKRNKEIKHYVFYGLATQRINELASNNSRLLDELYYAPSNPDFDVAASDNENRDRIFQIIAELPEVKACIACGSTWIYESPQTNDKNYYWIKVSDNNTGMNDLGNFKKFITKFNFFIYPKNFEIKFYDEKNKKLLSLAKWRKR